MRRIITIFNFLFVLIIMQLSGKEFNADVLYTIESGLSVSRISCLHQDSEGYLWIGTKDGLNKFDGYSFQVYRHQPGDSFSISNNYINTITESSTGDLWIGSNDGLHRYERKTGNFYKIKISDERDARLKKIYFLYCDRDDNIWVKTINELIRINSSSLEVKRYSHFYDEFTFIQGDNFFSIYEDNENNLWVGSKDGLLFFDKELELFERYSSTENDPSTISNNQVKSIYQDSEGILWIGTKNGLNSFHKETKKFKRYFSNAKDITTLSNNQVNTIIEDSKGYLWIGTQEGFDVFDKKNGKFTRYNSFNYNNKIFPCTRVTSIVEDKSHNLWIGCFEGLLKHDLKKKKFNVYRKTEAEKPDFSSNIISSIYQHTDGKIWLGTWGFGLNVFDRRTNEVEKYVLGDDNVYAIFRDEKEQVWLGTGDGVYIVKKEMNTQSLCEIYPELSCKFLENVAVQDFLQDKKGNIWIASTRGLHMVDAKWGTIRNIYNFKYEDVKVQFNNVFCLEEDDDGYIWIGTDYGLVKFFPENGFCYLYNKKEETFKGFGLSSNTVYSLCDDGKYLWIGTTFGLNKLNKNTEVFKLYAEKDGLPNNIIYSIEKDTSGYLWFSTNKGLVRFDSEKEVVDKFDVTDGLQSFEFILGSSYYNERTREMFFGGTDGLNAFFPDSIKKNTNVPNIVFTSMELIDEEGLHTSLIEKGQQLIIKPRVKVFTINFSSLDFTYPSKNNYAYNLYKDDSKKDEWVELGTKHSATFSSLSPGIYTFRVKGSNNDHVWNEEGTSIEIIVKAPLLQTKLAYAIYIVFAIIIIFGIFRMRTARLRKANKMFKERELAYQEIARQKEELAIKNKDITDSINYAKRIQEAMMPSQELFKKLMSESFILYKPKSIVSGDFYWINESNNKVFVAAIDCTGHGVPGAFMSLIGIELFRRITNIRGIEQPAQILNILNQNFSKIFSDVGNVSLKDGMDVSLCVIDRENNYIEFAGAFNPLYIVRNNTIMEIKGDRFSVGLSDEPGEGVKVTFTNHRIPMEKNDLYYIFSDGYADQFGGPTGRKYKKRRFRHLLLNIHRHSLSKQLQLIEESFEEWKGKFEQVDDVLVIGFRP